MTEASLSSLPERPDAMLLDFDGVILVSANIKTRAFAEVYKDEDPAKIEQVLSYQRAHGGVSRREKFIHYETVLFHRPATEARIQALCDAFERIALDRVLAAPFLPGALEFLETASRASRLHVVSGTPQDELAAIIAARGLARFFRSVVGAPTRKAPAFAQILRADAVAPARALAVGDSTTEFDAARSLGIPFLGVLDEDRVSAFPGDVPVVASLLGTAAALGFR